MYYDGMRFIDVMGTQRLAHRFVTISFFQEQWVPTNEEYVIDSFGLVLERDLFHLRENRRMLGAYLDGRYYGDPISVSVENAPDTIAATMMVRDGMLYVYDVAAASSVIQVFDLNANIILTGQPTVDGMLDLTSLVQGTYAVSVTDRSGNTRRQIVLIE